MTDRYAVIGNPIAQSKSPLIHAAFARTTGQDLEYTRIEAPLDAFAATALTLASVPEVQAKDAPPQVSEDGLQLTKSTKTRLVYVKPGATFSQYDRVAILDCYVEFEKDWQKDYNSSRVGLEGRVSDKDVERI